MTAAALNILVVEDEILLAMDIGAMIEDIGHTVLAEAACLQEVEELADDLAPDLALIDMHLAYGSSGLDVSKLVQKRWPDALIVFVTANVAKIPDDFSGGHGVIAKPFTHAGMTNAIRYLAEGILDPPPSGDRPSSLTTSPNLERRWAV